MLLDNATNYPNVSRTISGIGNIVFDTDVVLLCDTSLGIVELTLLEIPLNHFSTQYKLYVVDNSNIASINPININVSYNNPVALNGFNNPDTNMNKYRFDSGLDDSQYPSSSRNRNRNCKNCFDNARDNKWI